MESVELQADETALQFQLVDFEGAELIPNPGPGSTGPVLHVWGTVPCMNMAVQLVPVRYVRQPEYWAIQVIGHLPSGLCLEAIRDYHEILVHVPLGTKGVVVVGETMNLAIETPA